MLVELLLVESLREEDGVLALVGGRRAGEGGHGDRQGPFRGHRRRPLRRREHDRDAPGIAAFPRGSNERGTAARVRHLAREVPSHEIGGHSRQNSTSVPSGVD